MSYSSSLSRFLYEAGRGFAFNCLQSGGANPNNSSKNVAFFTFLVIPFILEIFISCLSLKMIS
jgi:hypothetical protein